MVTPACMGGWCAHRDHCALYHAAERSEPAERLCTPGHEQPVVIHMPAKQAEETSDEQP